MLSVIKLNVIMLVVVVLSVIMLGIIILGVIFCCSAEYHNADCHECLYAECRRLIVMCVVMPNFTSGIMLIVIMLNVTFLLLC